MVRGKGGDWPDLGPGEDTGIPLGGGNNVPDAVTAFVESASDVPALPESVMTPETVSKAVDSPPAVEKPPKKRKPRPDVAERNRQAALTPTRLRDPEPLPDYDALAGLDGTVEEFNTTPEDGESEDFDGDAGSLPNNTVKDEWADTVNTGHDRRTAEHKAALDALRSGAPKHADGWPRTPLSKHISYRYDSMHTDRQPSACFEYVRSLPDYARRRMCVYVYRLWPVLDLPSRDPKGVKLVLDEVADLSVEYLSNRFGSGDYFLLVNDQTEKVRSGTNTVCKCLVQFRDLANYPPIISEWSTDLAKAVSWSDPLNATYIRYLEQNRVPVPGSGVPALENIRTGSRNPMEDEEEEENETMSVIQDITRNLADQNERLMDRVLADSAQPAAVPTPPATDNVAVAAMQAIASMAKTMMENKPEPAPAAPSMSVGDVINAAREFVKLTQPPPPPDNAGQSMMMDFMKSQLAAQEARNAAAETRNAELLKAIMESNKAAAAAAAPAVPSVTDRIREVAEIREMLSDVTGGGSGGGGRESAAPWWATALKEFGPALAPALPGIIRGLGSLLSGPVLPAMPQGIQGQPQYVQQPPYPMAPVQPQGQPQGPYQPPAQPSGLPYLVTAPQEGQPQQSPDMQAQQPHPQAGQVELQLPQQLTEEDLQNPMIQALIVKRAMDQLGPMIVKLMASGRHGSDLADMIVTMDSRQTYDNIAAYGQERIMQACAEHPSTAASYTHNREVLAEFVGQFLAGPDAPDDGDGEDGESGIPA